MKKLSFLKLPPNLIFYELQKFDVLVIPKLSVCNVTDECHHTSHLAFHASPPFPMGTTM